MLAVAPVTRAPDAGCSRWRCGAARRSTRRCASCKEDPWQRLAELREADSEHPVPDAAARRERRRLHELPRQRRQGVRQGGGRPPGIDVFRIFDALNWRRRTCGSRIEAVADDRPLRRGGDLLHRRHPRSDAPKYDLKYYVDLAKETGELGTHILAIKDMAGAAASRTRRRSWSKALARRSRCRSTSTRTTPAGNAIGVVPRGRRRGRRHRRWRGRPHSPGMTVAAVPRSSRRCALAGSPRDRADRHRRASRSGRTTGRRCASTTAPFETGKLASGRRVRPRNARAGSTRTCTQQAQTLGLGDRWQEVGRTYADGEPAVRRHRQGDADVEGRRRHGDLHGRTTAWTREGGPRARAELTFPESVVEFFEGRSASRRAASPRRCRSTCSEGREPLDGRPGAEPAADRLRRRGRELERS